MGYAELLIQINQIKQLIDYLNSGSSEFGVINAKQNYLVRALEEDFELLETNLQAFNELLSLKKSRSKSKIKSVSGQAQNVLQFKWLDAYYHAVSLLVKVASIVNQAIDHRLSQIDRNSQEAEQYAGLFTAPISMLPPHHICFLQELSAKLRDNSEYQDLQQLQSEIFGSQIFCIILYTLSKNPTQQVLLRNYIFKTDLDFKILNPEVDSISTTDATQEFSKKADLLKKLLREITDIPDDGVVEKLTDRIKYLTVRIKSAEYGEIDLVLTNNDSTPAFSNTNFIKNLADGKLVLPSPMLYNDTVIIPSYKVTLDQIKKGHLVVYNFNKYIQERSIYHLANAFRKYIKFFTLGFFPVFYSPYWGLDTGLILDVWDRVNEKYGLSFYDIPELLCLSRQLPSDPTDVPIFLKAVIYQLKILPERMSVIKALDEKFHNDVAALEVILAELYNQELQSPDRSKLFLSSSLNVIENASAKKRVSIEEDCEQTLADLKRLAENELCEIKEAIIVGQKRYNEREKRKRRAQRDGIRKEEECLREQLNTEFNTEYNILLDLWRNLIKLTGLIDSYEKHVIKLTALTDSYEKQVSKLFENSEKCLTTKPGARALDTSEPQADLASKKTNQRPGRGYGKSDARKSNPKAKVKAKSKAIMSASAPVAVPVTRYTSALDLEIDNNIFNAELIFSQQAIDSGCCDDPNIIKFIQSFNKQLGCLNNYWSYIRRQKLQDITNVDGQVNGSFLTFIGLVHSKKFRSLISSISDAHERQELLENLRSNIVSLLHKSTATNSTQWVVCALTSMLPAYKEINTLLNSRYKLEEVRTLFKKLIGNGVVNSLIFTTMTSGQEFLMEVSRNFMYLYKDDAIYDREVHGWLFCNVYRLTIEKVQASLREAMQYLFVLNHYFSREKQIRLSSSEHAQEGIICLEKVYNEQPILIAISEQLLFIAENNDVLDARYIRDAKIFLSIVEGYLDWVNYKANQGEELLISFDNKIVINAIKLIGLILSKNIWIPGAIPSTLDVSEIRKEFYSKELIDSIVNIVINDTTSLNQILQQVSTMNVSASIQFNFLFEFAATLYTADCQNYSVLKSEIGQAHTSAPVETLDSLVEMTHDQMLTNNLDLYFTKLRLFNYIFKMAVTGNGDSYSSLQKTSVAYFLAFYAINLDKLFDINVLTQQAVNEYQEGNRRSATCLAILKMHNYLSSEFTEKDLSTLKDSLEKYIPATATATDTDTDEDNKEKRIGAILTSLCCFIQSVKDGVDKIKVAMTGSGLQLPDSGPRRTVLALASSEIGAAAESVAQSTTTSSSRLPLFPQS